MFTRPIERSWGHWHPVVHVTGGCGRPLRGGHVALADEVANVDGPAYKGMDPSDPGTWVRPWNPQPGMVGYLNFDGAAQQERTPTGGVRRGSQRRGARGSR